MKKILLKLFALFMVVAFIQSCNEPLIEGESADELELKSASATKTSYIVLLNDDDLNTELIKFKGYEKKQAAVKSSSAKILKRAGITDGEIGHVYGTALKGFSVKIAPGQLKKLQDDPSVSYIEEDQIISLGKPEVTPYKRGGNKPGGGGSTTPDPQVTPWGISRVGGAVDGTGKTAWIIDSGIDQNHPDLNVDTGRSRTFLGGKSTPDDQHGHGTHVAGTIAAINNKIGVVGVASGANVVAVRVLNRRGSGSTSGVIAGVDYVGSIGKLGEVANMSLGGSPYQLLDDAVINASNASGVKFVLAAGNEGDDANNHSPARANGENIYTISAMDSSNEFAYFSNYGNPPIDYCAPGVRIYSCYKNGGYGTMSGTSMAAPHAAGVLLMSTNNNINIDGIVIGDQDNNPDPIIHR